MLLENKLSNVREERDQLQKAVDRVDDLEQKIERLENQRRLILEEREEKVQLVRYVENSVGVRRRCECV